MTWLLKVHLSVSSPVRCMSFQLRGRAEFQLALNYISISTDVATLVHRFWSRPKGSPFCLKPNVYIYSITSILNCTLHLAAAKKEKCPCKEIRGTGLTCWSFCSMKVQGILGICRHVDCCCCSKASPWGTLQTCCQKYPKVALETTKHQLTNR